MPQRNWLAYAGLASLWGLALTLVRGIVGAVGWAQGAWATSLVVAIAIAGFAVARGRSLDWRLGWPPVLLLGAAVSVQNIGIAVAVDRAGIALTAVVLATVPLWGTLFGQVWGLDRITFATAAGLVAGFCGLLLVVGFPASGSSWDFISGTIAGLLGAIAAAFCRRYLAAGRRLAGRVEAASASYLVAAVLTLPLVFVFPGTGAGGLGGWLMVLVLGVLVAGAGYGLEFVVAERTDVARAAGAKVAGMALAVLLGAFLGEGLSFGQYVGALILLGGDALVLGIYPRRARTAARR